MPIRKPEEMPKKYREDYMRNFMSRMRRLPPAVPDLVGACVRCGREGVLCYEPLKIMHRGDIRPTNRLCARCWKHGAA